MSDDKSQGEISGPSSPKKLKVDDGKEKHSKLELNDFVVEKILSNNSLRKSVSVLGKFKDKSGTAVIILEKNAFKQEDLGSDGFFNIDNEVQELVKNDIYGDFECFPRPQINGIKTSVIYPATDKHIQKYSRQVSYLVSETPELYNKVTLPHIQQDQFNLQWVYNILEGKSEKERVIYENNNEVEGFLLLPDLKWNAKNTETLYLLAIIKQRGIKSIRDLNANHLGLLKRVRDEGKKAIFEQFKLPGSQLRIYFHYQPSFYHLHIHFTYLRHEAPGIYAEKAHLLDTVINNIEMMSDYYQKATIPFIVREMCGLFKAYEANGILEKFQLNIENKDPIVPVNQ